MQANKAFKVSRYWWVMGVTYDVQMTSRAAVDLKVLVGNINII